MIQRKQTVFLLLALAAIIVCLCLPLGAIEPKGMGVPALFYNIGLYANGGYQVHPLLFVDLVITGALTLACIPLFKKRKMQMKICVANIVLSLVWYGYYAFCVLHLFKDMGTFHPRFAGCLPLVALILFVLAYRGIKADEELIRSMDRIR